MMVRWKGEPMSKRLTRLAERAQKLAQRLGKGDIHVDVEAGDIRLPRELWSKFWSAFVHVIRNGLEVVASLRAASQKWERPYDIDECVRRWNADVGYSLARLHSSSDRVVLYEMLTAQPEATLRQLLADLDLPWEAGLQDRLADTARSLVTQEESWKEGIGSGIRASATSAHALDDDERERARRGLDTELYERLRDGLAAT